MSNLLFNIRFGNWYLQLNKDWNIYFWGTEFYTKNKVKKKLSWLEFYSLFGYDLFKKDKK